MTLGSGLTMSWPFSMTLSLPSSTLWMAAAIACAWAPSWRPHPRLMIPLWLLTLGGAIVSAWQEQFITAQGVIIMLGFAAGLWALEGVPLTEKSRRWWRGGLLVAVFLLGVRRLPGFESVVWAEGLRVSEQAGVFRISFHMDQGLAALVLVRAFAQRCSSPQEWRAALRGALWPTVITTVGVLLLGMAVGHVRWDPKWPEFTAVHFTKILLWTTTLEEAFFRCVLQAGIAAGLAKLVSPSLKWTQALWVAPLLGALPFGLAHLGGGWTYVGLATAAGLGYGLAYAKTQRIEAAMLAHFTLNTAHFLLFTYPGVKPGG
jgi:uncharacterized protein